MTNHISIAIPVYECHGIGWLYLSELLNSIFKQSEKNIEVVISDQSTDDKIFNLCNFYSSMLNLKYIKADNIIRSNSPNVNNAIKYCTAQYVKVMFQDDFFIDNRAIEKTLKLFQSGAKWVVCGCMHCESIHYMYRPFIPKYNDKILYGVNTISSPSVLSFIDKEYFDEKLIMLMDCEIYHKLYTKYGEPTILNEYLICNRQHANQLQNLNQDKLASEINYCKNKYNIKETVYA
jgi:glycosyltransferase involved in cell wall biosynthesis